jgi:general secretion pathway protein D
VLIGGGDGTFSSNFEIPVGTNPQSIVTADFNDDSKLDVAAANSGSNNVTVVLNSSAVFTGTGANGSIGTPYPNVQYIDLGVKVKATPRIHANDEVTLNLDFTVSSIAAQSFNSIPVLNDESVTHIVRLKQDQTSVIASFLEPQTSNNVNGTPGIVGVPGLEWLAQNQNLTRQDTEIIFLVTPRMVRYAPRENRVIYAGQGALEGQGSAPAPVFTPAQAPPSAPGALQPPGAQVPVQPQPGQPQPGQAPGQQPTPTSQPQNPAQTIPSGQTAPPNAPAPPVVE